MGYFDFLMEENMWVISRKELVFTCPDHSDCVSVYYDGQLLGKTYLEEDVNSLDDLEELVESGLYRRARREYMDLIFHYDSLDVQCTAQALDRLYRCDPQWIADVYAYLQLEKGLLENAFEDDSPEWWSAKAEVLSIADYWFRIRR